PSTPAPLRWLVERCLSKDPGGRFAATSDLARDLAMIRDHLEEAPAGAEGSLRQRRSRTRFALGVAAALALGSVLGAILFRPKPAPFPAFHQISCTDEPIQSARFASAGQPIVYGTLRDGKVALFSTRVGSIESRPLGLEADILALSSIGEMAILLGGPGQPL